MTQWCKRDKIYGSNNDYVELYINPYMDGQTDFCFKLTPYGVQEDKKIGQDFLKTKTGTWFGLAKHQ